MGASRGDPERAGARSLGLGPDADTVDARRRWRRCSREHPMRLHGFLRDQHVLAGLGRRLANEICHRARALAVRQHREARPPTRSTRLAEAIQRVHRRVARLRARAATDMSSSKERPGAVHHRDGEPCPVCGDTVRAVEYRRYTVNYCATCQTGGKVLADNTTSKFLK